jgi:hypothetical protein
LGKRGVVKQLAMQYDIAEQTVRDLKEQKDQLISFASSFNLSEMKMRNTMKKST